MNHQNETGVAVKIQLTERFVERLLIFLLSSFFSFNTGVIYAKQNSNRNFVYTVESSKVQVEKY